MTNAETGIRLENADFEIFMGVRDFAGKIIEMPPEVGSIKVESVAQVGSEVVSTPLSQYSCDRDRDGLTLWDDVKDEFLYMGRGSDSNKLTCVDFTGSNIWGKPTLNKGSEVRITIDFCDQSKVTGVTCMSATQAMNFYVS